MSPYDIYREKFEKSFNSVKLDRVSGVNGVTKSVSLSSVSNEVYVADVHKLFNFLVLNDNGINDKIKQKLETVYRILNKNESQINAAVQTNVGV